YLPLPAHMTPACLILSFFLYLASAHHDLHSFPTRRSSDLSFCSFNKTATGINHADILPIKSQSVLKVWAYCSLCRSTTLANRLADRKSTRLNSSHVSISYAVFCLKKKTNQNNDNDNECIHT